MVVPTSEEVDEAEQLRLEDAQKEQDQAEKDRERKELEDGVQPKPPAKKQDKGNQPPKGKDVAKKPRPRNKDKRDPLADIKARGNTLALPANHQADLLARTVRFKMLATLYTTRLDGCRLRLMTGLGNPDGDSYELFEESSEDRRRRVWTVRRARAADSDVGDKPAAGSSVGVFELREVELDNGLETIEQRLFFAWDKRAQRKEAQGLRGMQLEVRVGGQAEICSFQATAGFAPVAIKFERRRELGPDLSSLEAQLKGLDQDTLFVELVPRGFPPTARLNVRGANVQEDDIPLADAGRLLRQIRLADLQVRGGRRYSIVIPSEVDGSPDLVSIRLGFHPPGHAGHIGLSVTWECLVLQEITLMSRPSLTLGEAERAPMRVAAFLKKMRRQELGLRNMIVGLEIEISKVIRNFNSLQSRDAEMAAALFGRIDRKRRELVAKRNAAKISLKDLLARILSAQRYASIPDSVTRAMKTVHGKSTIGWRLYCKRAGLEINVASGE